MLKPVTPATEKRFRIGQVAKQLGVVRETAEELRIRLRR